jgi:hypothetical protein
MKIKNLLLLGLMVFGSMNASASDFKAGGLVYDVNQAAKTATVIGIRTGYITATQKSIEIPATITDGDGVVCKVTGFNTTYWNTAAYPNTDYQTTAAPTCESIIINIDNFAKEPTVAQLTFATLKSITLKGTSTINNDYQVLDYAGAVANLETLDLDELAAKSGKKVVLNAQTALATPKLKTVTLPGIDLPTNAFAGQTALESVTGVKNIGSSAFDGAKKLATITFTGTVIGNKAFNDAAALTTIDLSAVETIGKKAFYGTKITTANLAAATKIGEQAFEGVATLTTITLKSTGDPNTVTIGDKAFFNCTGVEELTIPATVAYENGTTATGVFDGMTKLATLTINNEVIPAIFTTDAAITNLTIANANLTNIAPTTFTAATGLTQINLSKCPALTSVSGAFATGMALTKVRLAGSKVDYGDIDFSNATASLKTITFSTATTAIGTADFQNFAKLATVVLPSENLLSIGDNAFEGTALTAITIPEGVTVGQYAFYNCAALASVEFEYDAETTPIALTTIDNGAFEGCTALTAVRFPANVDFGGVYPTSDGTDAFKDCAALKTFVAQCTEDGVYGLKDVPAAFTGCDKLKAVVFPKTVATIADNAFKDCAKLATVTFQHEGADDAASTAMTYMGVSAFEGTAITEIDLSMTQLPDLDQDYIFKGCASLATITLPEEMNSLQGNEIFGGTAIETLDLSMVNGWIGDSYYDLTSSKWVANTLFGTDEDNPNTTLKVLKVGNALIYGLADTKTTAKSGAFQYCQKLKTVIAGAADIYANAFAYCDKLTTVTVLPYDVDTNNPAWIVEGAFDHCSALTTFNYYPETVDPTQFGTVDGRAFTGCTPFATFNTCQEFRTWYEKVDPSAPKGKGWGGAPINTAWTADLVTTIVKTVQDKANPNQFIGKFVSAYDASFDANDAKLYSVYMDGETAYYAACRVDDGRYYVPGGKHVILKTEEATEVSWNVESTASMGNSAVGFDDVKSLTMDGDLAEIQDALNLMPGQWVYRFTNTEEQGFGFTYYSGKTVKADQFFVASTLKPEGAGRLEQVWLDEDGNVESNTTAIQKIQNAEVEKGAVYNLQGVRVQKAQKGLYIQNGKKLIIK